MSIPALLAWPQWIIVVGFGVFCVPAIRNLLSGRDIPIWVFPFMDAGRSSGLAFPRAFRSWRPSCWSASLRPSLVSCSGAGSRLVLCCPRAGAGGRSLLVGVCLIPPIVALVWTILILMSWQALPACWRYSYEE
jgi:hypothetical protein